MDDIVIVAQKTDLAEGGGDSNRYDIHCLYYGYEALALDQRQNDDAVYFWREVDEDFL